MKTFALGVSMVMVCALTITHALEVGEKSPEFVLKDAEGKEHRLADMAGKLVVLEWINHDCPFVKKHYGSGNMQKLQETYTEKGVIWLSVCSSAEGKQGYLTPDAWKARMVETKSKATAVLLDADGAVGRAYDAKTTPHMYIIDADGILRYMGAIDSDPSWDPKTIEKAVNHVRVGLDALLDGKPVENSVTKPYGCSVKY